MSSSSRSSSPAELPVAKKKTKTKTKTKTSSKGTAQDEGLDPSWPFAVPAGYNLCGANPDDEVDENFDWDTLKSNPNLELWLIRVPHNLPLKHLDSVPLSLSSSHQPEKVGELTRKQTTYDIWSSNASRPDNESGRVGGDISVGEEMNSITCLLPRKSNQNTLYTAPKPISRHIVITAQPTQVQHVSNANEKPVTILQNPPRQSYPPELLKHRFMPCGSLAPVSPLKEDKEAMQRPKTKSKERADITETLHANEASDAIPSVSMNVDSTSPKSEKRDKKEGKAKRGATVTELSQDAVSGSSTTEANKTAKKRKGSEAGQEAMEGKKHKKHKTKAV